MIGPSALLVATLIFDAGVADAGSEAGGAARDGGRGEAATPATDGGEPDASGTPAVPPPMGRVAGRVIAKGTRGPIAGASLTADVTEVGASDANGDFDIAVPCGPRRISIQAPGFERLFTDVDVCGRSDVPMTLRLEPAAPGHAFETVVRSKPAQPEVRLAGEELIQTPGTLGDPFRAIESLPGVATVAWPAPIYAVRGSNPGNTGFFLDGVRVPGLFHFALGPSVIHPYFFDSLEFFPGGYPARFGRYAAGIVSADTRPPATDRLHSSVDVRLFDAGALVSAPLPDNGAVAVAGRYSYTAGLISLLNQDIRVEYWDYQLRADRRVGRFQLTLLAFGSNDVLVPKQSDTVREVDLGFHRVSLRAVVPMLGGRLQGSLAVGSDHSRAPVVDMFPVTVDAKSAAPRLAFIRPFGPADVVVGFDAELARYEPVVIGTLQPSGDWDLAQRRDVYLLAGFVSASVRATSRVSLTPELRLDTYDVNGTNARDLAPRLTARFALRDDTTLRIAGGRFTQLPSLPLQIPGAEAFGLRLLGLQSSWQASVALETNHFAAVEVAVTGYVQHYLLTDLRDPRPSDPDPLAEDFLIRRDALSYGVELLARRPPTHRLHGWLSYTVSNNLRSFGGGAVGPSDWDQRHIFNLVVGYRWNRTIIGGRAHLNTGRPYIVYDATGEHFERLPAFYQVDLRIDRRFIYDKFILNIYLELVNATLSRQVYAFGQSPSGSGQLEEKSFRLVLPSFGIRAEF